MRKYLSTTRTRLLPTTVSQHEQYQQRQSDDNESIRATKSQPLRHQEKSNVINNKRRSWRLLNHNRGQYLHCALLVFILHQSYLLLLLVSCERLETSSSLSLVQSDNRARDKLVDGDRRDVVEPTPSEIHEPTTALQISARQQSIPAANPNFEAAFQGECGKNNNSNPCEHICLDLHDGTYECSCFYGFTLAVDGYSCAHLSPQPTSTPADAAQRASVAEAAATNAHTTKAPSKLSKAPPDSWAAAGANSQSVAEIGGNPFGVPATTSTDNDIRPSSGAASIPGSGGSRLKPSNGLVGNDDEWFEQSANDNRKLADELARGVLGRTESTVERSSSALNKIGQARNASESEPDTGTRLAAAGRSGQRMLLGAAARRIRQQRERELAGLAKEARVGGGAMVDSIEAGGSRNGNSNKMTGTTTTQQQQHKLQAKFQHQLPANRITPQLTSLTVTGLPATTSGGGGFSQIEQQDEPPPWPTKVANMGQVEGRQSPPQPQTTIAGAPSYGSVDVVDKVPQASRATKQQQQQHRLTYDMDEDWQQTNGGQWNQTNQLTELGLDGLDLDSLELSLAGSEAQATVAAFQEDPEVKSIMIDNDKLVASLARSVASAARQAETNNEQQMVWGGNSRHHPDEPPAPSGNASDDDPNKQQQQQQDYEMNLLVNLVRRTMIEEDNYSISDTELMKLRNQPTTDHHHHHQHRKRQRQRQWQSSSSSSGNSRSSDEINEPFPIPAPPSPIALDQSSKKPSERSAPRKRRRANNNRLSGQKFSDSIKASAGSVTNSLALAQAAPGADNDARECEEATSAHRNCLEMPECESGGRCFVEVHWISERNSDMAQLEDRARCRCPIGRGGQLCQKPIQRSTPRFMGHSYLALPMITEPSITSLRLVFKPQTRSGSAGAASSQSSLLLHAQRFQLILDDSQRVELRYSTRAPPGATHLHVNSTSGHRSSPWETTRVMGSRDAVQGQWNELIVTDVLSDRHWDGAGTEDDRIILVTPERIHLDHKQMAQELFVGGKPELARLSEQAPLTVTSHKSQVHHHGAAPMIGGFVGCIRELSINGRQYKFRSDLEGDALDGFDVG